MIWFTDDLSENKASNQSRVSKSCPQCVANYAVDRNITTCMQTEDIGKQASEHTTLWSVDLGKIHRIHNMRIQFRKYNQEYGTNEKNDWYGIGSVS